MNIDTKLSPIDTLRWYAAMDADAVLSTDSNRWSVVVDRHNGDLSRGVLAQGEGGGPETYKNWSPDILQAKFRDDASSRSLADAATSLEQLKAALLSFNRCELKKTATHTVFGDGVPTAKIMLIGEAPGVSEDATGVPFCGESGKLLDNMISTIGLTRLENVYITNTIFWRPPANRRPTAEEVEICRPFVEKHIALIQPELLILVGATAVTSLLGDHLQISKIRQEYYQYQNQYLAKPITTTALFHPAYLLRQPFQKKATWYDLLKIQELLQSNNK